MGFRRWRYIVPALAFAVLAPTLVRADDSSSSSAPFSVKCWRVETSVSNKLTITRAAVDDACPVSVSIADLPATFAPGDDIPTIWSVTLKSALETSNTVDMPLPPPPTSNGGTTAPAQISATYVRSCVSVATCDPSSTALTSSAVRSSNFTTAGKPLSFASSQGVKFSQEGVFPIAAFVAVRDAVSPGVAYVFAAYASVTIRASKPSVDTTITKGVVQCRFSRQSALNATLDPDFVSVSRKCELRVALAPLAVVRPNHSVAVSWVATLAPSEDAEMHLPSPLTPVYVESAGAAYEIVASYVKLCKDAPSAPCDEYTPLDQFQDVVSAGPASFSPVGNVTFTSPSVFLATAGRHTAMLHMVVAGPERRYDFVYYLDLLATDVAPTVDATDVKTDATTSYCWDVLADATRSDANATNVAAAATATACPYLSTLALPPSPVPATTRFNLSWSVAANVNYSATASALATNVNLTAAYDTATKTDVTLPTLNVYACGNGTVCSPFSTDKTLLLSLPARNFDNGQATIAVDGLSFPNEGNYTILAHSVVPNGASRIDTAVYATVNVAQAPVETASPSAATHASKRSHTAVYVVVAVVCVLVVVGGVLGAVWFRRRRQRDRMEKMVQFGMFGAPSRTHGTVLHNTDSRGSFQSGDSGRESFSFLRVQASQPSPIMVETPRDGSLSYDPYQRPSFQDMSVNESNLSFAFTENERPSTQISEDGEHGVMPPPKVYDV